jgi:hypothetical protein
MSTNPVVIKANDFLSLAVRDIKKNTDFYDNLEGERSMAATVSAFNAITGHCLTVEQGWKFMVMLKLARSESGAHKRENYSDGTAYFALAGEASEQESTISTSDSWGREL